MVQCAKHSMCRIWGVQDMGSNPTQRNQSVLQSTKPRRISFADSGTQQGMVAGDRKEQASLFVTHSLLARQLVHKVQLGSTSTSRQAVSTQNSERHSNTRAKKVVASPQSAVRQPKHMASPQGAGKWRLHRAELGSVSTMCKQAMKTGMMRPAQSQENVPGHQMPDTV